MHRVPFHPGHTTILRTCACWVPAALPVWMCTSTSMTSAMHASSSLQGQAYIAVARQMIHVLCIVTTGAFTMHLRTPPDPCSQLNFYWHFGHQGTRIKSAFVLSLNSELLVTGLKLPLAIARPLLKLEACYYSEELRMVSGGW